MVTKAMWENTSSENIVASQKVTSSKTISLKELHANLYIHSFGHNKIKKINPLEHPQDWFLLSAISSGAMCGPVWSRLCDYTWKAQDKDDTDERAIKTLIKVPSTPLQEMHIKLLDSEQKP